MMMLIILPILLPLVHSLREDCHALDVEIVKPDNLTQHVKEELERSLSAKNVSNIDGIATYYIGFPDSINNENFQFTAVCVSATGLPELPYCLNVTSMNEDFSSSEISEEQFLSFYRNCTNDLSFELPYTTTATTVQTEDEN